MTFTHNSHQCMSWLLHKNCPQMISEQALDQKSAHLLVGTFPNFCLEIFDLHKNIVTVT